MYVCRYLNSTKHIDWYLTYVARNKPPFVEFLPMNDYCFEKRKSPQIPHKAAGMQIPLPISSIYTVGHACEHVQN